VLESFRLLRKFGLEVAVFSFQVGISFFQATLGAGGGGNLFFQASPVGILFFQATLAADEEVFGLLESFGLVRVRLGVTIATEEEISNSIRCRLFDDVSKYPWMGALEVLGDSVGEIRHVEVGIVAICKTRVTMGIGIAMSGYECIVREMQWGGSVRQRKPRQIHCRL